MPRGVDGHALGSASWAADVAGRRLDSRRRRSGAGEAADDAGRQVDPADTIGVDVGDVERRARRVERDAQDSGQLRGRRGAAVAPVGVEHILRSAVAGHGRDDAGGIDLSNAEVAVVGDIDGPVGGDRDPVGNFIAAASAGPPSPANSETVPAIVVTVCADARVAARQAARSSRHSGTRPGSIDSRTGQPFLRAPMRSSVRPSGRLG